MSRLRLGIIGTGLIWQTTHETILPELTDLYSIAAFCDANEQAEERIRSKYPEVPFYRDYHDVLKSPDIDAAVVFTPLHLNARVTKAALEAGKIVFVEKPCCTTAADATEIVDLSERLSLPVFVLEQVVYSPRLTALENIVKSGAIGRPVFFDLMSHFRISEDLDCGGFGKTAWRQRPEFPLGTLMDGGIHDLARCSSVFGAPTTVSATGCTLREGFGDYDHIFASMKFADDLSGAFSHAGFMPSHRYFRIHGAEGTVIDDPNGLVVQRDGQPEERVEADDWNSRGMWEHFAQCLQQGAEPRYSIRQAAGDVKTLVAMAEAIESKSIVTV